MALRWAVVGAGKITNDFVTACQIFPNDHRIVAVGSGSKANAEKFAKEHNIPKAYEGYQQIAKDDEIDVVYIGNLNTQHHATAKLMLEHGKPVLCEKPLTMNEKQTKELVELARKKNVFLMEAVWSRCFPAYRKVKELIDQGTIGDVVSVNVSFGFNLTGKERVTSKELGGGVTLDIGVYTLQFQQFIYKGLKPIKVAVNGHLNDAGTDETVGTVITYPGGKIATLLISGRVELPNEAVVNGTKGAIRVPNFWCPTKVITDEKTYDFPLPESVTGTFLHLNSAGMNYEAFEVKRCLKNGLIESDMITHEETIQLAKLMDDTMKEVGVVFN